MWYVFLIILFTTLSGYGDARGFIHASRIWQDGKFIWQEALRSAVGFQFGVLMFWIALRYLGRFGVIGAEVQTLIWFGVTIIGVAALSGRFLRWGHAEQAVALLVLAGIGWLLYRDAQ